jgi:general secretion pathway protein L
MAETLFIRLGSEKTEKISWLIWSAEQQEIIASGELLDAAQLIDLKEKTNNRTVICFVPSCDVLLKKINVPGKSTRAIKLAAPYMLEDDLAEDVETLFFAYAPVKNTETKANCYIAAVAHKQMQQWLSWLENAGINSKQMLPDALALPLATDGSWTAIEHNQQILCRLDNFQAVTVDNAIWPLYLAKKSAAINEVQTITSYSSIAIEDEKYAVELQPAELPLALLAQNHQSCPLNLLQGQYKSQEKVSPYRKYWLTAASIFTAVLLLNVVEKVTYLSQLSAQQQQLEEQIISHYKKAFPNSKRVRIATVKSQIKQKLSEVGSSAQQSDFLQALTEIQPAFASVKNMKPTAIKYDGKRDELRIQAVADGYQPFEQFKNLLEKRNFKVTQGALTSQDNRVSGSFSIKGQL